jgi:hypothetical protein
MKSDPCKRMPDCFHFYDLRVFAAASAASLGLAVGETSNSSEFLNVGTPVSDQASS